MLLSKCDLKTHVQNLGYPISLQIGGPKTTFLGRLRNLMATLTAYIFGMKHDITLSGKCVGNYNGSLTSSQKCHEIWCTNGLKFDLHFAHLFKFCILLHCQASQTEISKWYSAKLFQTVDSRSR